MHPVSILTFGIFFAGYITARWDLVTRLYELAIFAWDHGVIVRLRTVSQRMAKANDSRHAPRKASSYSRRSSSPSCIPSIASQQTRQRRSVRQVSSNLRQKQSLTTRSIRVAKTTLGYLLASS